MPDKPGVSTSTKRHCRDSCDIHDFSSVVMSSQINLQADFQFDYTLIWIQQGEGELYIDTQAFSLSTNILFCLRRGQELRFPSAVSGNGFVVSFSAEFLDLHETKTTDIIQESFFNRFLVTPAVRLKDDSTSFMHCLASKMLEESSGSSAYKTEMLIGFLKVFIIHTSRAAYTINHPYMLPKKITLVQQFHSLLEKYFVSKKLVKDYAGMLHVSASYLNDVVREISGAAASYHIQQRIFREAKRKLFFHGSSMKEVAYSLGFTDQAHFSKYFKNISGKNFTDFKKEITSRAGFQ